MEQLVAERRVECQSDAETLWPVLTDTERMNRAVGFGALQASPVSNRSAARYEVTSELVGMPVRWQEEPFVWAHPEHFEVVRHMLEGPMTRLRFGFRLAPAKAGKTAVTVWLDVVPRAEPFRAPLEQAAAQVADRFAAEVRKVDRALAERAPLPRAGKRKGLHNKALERAVEALRETEPEGLCDRLAEHLRTASDVDLTRIRPYALADAWQVDRRQTLTTCLRAVGAGLLELRWEIICPSCRTGTEAYAALEQLQGHGRCQLCDLDFDVDLQSSVEVTFAPPSCIRAIDLGPYCVGGPARTPHVLSQAILPARGRAQLCAPEDLGLHRLFVRGGASLLLDVTPQGAQASELDDELTSASSPLQVAPGATLTVTSSADEDRHVKLERSQFRNQAASASQVMAMPAFRREFTSEVLRSDMALKVTRVGLFFSDLTGSTEMYARIGDAAAFKLVQDHFDILVAILERHGGVLVKTIGDAVMGAFDDELAGFTAAVEVLQRFDALARQDPRFAEVTVKLGYYAGSCYAVTANGQLDYFGQSVNIAARLQGQAEGGELIAPVTLAERAVAEGLMPAAAIRSRYDAELKGVAERIHAGRIRV